MIEQVEQRAPQTDKQESTVEPDDNRDPCAAHTPDDIRRDGRQLRCSHVARLCARSSGRSGRTMVSNCVSGQGEDVGKNSGSRASRSRWRRVNAQAACVGRGTSAEAYASVRGRRRALPRRATPAAFRRNQKDVCDRRSGRGSRRRPSTRAQARPRRPGREHGPVLGDLAQRAQTERARAILMPWLRSVAHAGTREHSGRWAPAYDARTSLGRVRPGEQPLAAEGEFAETPGANLSSLLTCWLRVKPNRLPARCARMSVRACVPLVLHARDCQGARCNNSRAVRPCPVLERNTRCDLLRVMSAV